MTLYERLIYANESLMTPAMEMSSLTHEVLTWSGDQCGGRRLLMNRARELAPPPPHAKGHEEAGSSMDPPCGKEEGTYMDNERRGLQHWRRR
jgi:hypothetical protein